MYNLVTPAESEAVSVSELKAQLRITSTDQDTLLGQIIVSARQFVEDYTRCALMPSTWDLYLDEFPKSVSPHYFIYIQKNPVTAISYIKYKDASNVLQTLNSSLYEVDYYAKPCRIYPAYSKEWPSTVVMPNVVNIRFIAGYTDVPEQIKQGILMLAATLYENPSDEVTGTQVNRILRSSEYLLRPLRIYRF